MGARGCGGKSEIRSPKSEPNPNEPISQGGNGPRDSGHRGPFDHWDIGNLVIDSDFGLRISDLSVHSYDVTVEGQFSFPLPKPPMLYDVHTHLGLDTGFFLRGWWPYAATAQDLLQVMDANDIDRAVCFPFCLPSAFDAIAYADRHAVELLPGRVPFDRENKLLAQEIERIDVDHRLFMLAMFDPSRCVHEQLANLERLRGKYVGLKVQATVLESPISALLGVGRPLMEFAQAHAMPVLFHTSILPSDRWSPAEDCLKVAEAFPKARFNLAHSLRFHAPSLRAAGALPNVWVDCSAHLSHCRLAVENSPIVAAKGERVDADYTRPGAGA